MKKTINKKWKKFHKLMKSGRLYKVASAVGIATHQRHVGDLNQEFTSQPPA